MAGVFINAVRYFITFLQFVILARALLSWFPAARGGPFSLMVYSLSEPILGPIRRLLRRTPLGTMMMDLSPIFAFMLLRAGGSVIIGIVHMLI